MSLLPLAATVRRKKETYPQILSALKSPVPSGALFIQTFHKIRTRVMKEFAKQINFQGSKPPRPLGTDF